MNILDTLQGVLGGNGQGIGGNLARVALEMLQNNSHGGLGGLLDQFAKHGMGEQAGSWISTGRNLPISAEDIMRVLGSGQVQSLAQRAGLTPDAASGELARILPQLIDHLTPHGKLPDNDLLAQAFSMLQGKLG
jgi:uncharacterized protein YidB (DUF937 family)